MGSGELLTTCAGAGATMVAIIGGFLLSRFMSIESEIRGANRALADVEERLETAEQRTVRARTPLVERDIDEHFDNERFIKRLIEHAKDGTRMSLDETTNLLELQTFIDDELQSRLDVWNDEARKAEDSPLWDVVDDSTFQAPLRSLAEEQGVRIEVFPIWQARFRMAKLDVRDRLVGGLLGLMDNDRDTKQADPDLRGRLEGRMHDAVNTRDALLAERRVARVNQASIGEPVGLYRGIVVLLVVAALTIVPSLLLLAPRPANLSRMSSGIVVALFLGGLVLLIGYVAAHAGRARIAWSAVNSGHDIKAHATSDTPPADSSGSA